VPEPTSIILIGLGLAALRRVAFRGFSTVVLNDVINNRSGSAVPLEQKAV